MKEKIIEGRTEEKYKTELSTVGVYLQLRLFVLLRLRFSFIEQYEYSNIVSEIICAIVIAIPLHSVRVAITNCRRMGPFRPEIYSTSSLHCYYNILTNCKSECHLKS